MIRNEFAANTLRLARVTHVHPEGQKMEVIFLDTGDYGRDVQLASPMAGTDFGFTSGVPAPDTEGHDANMTNDPDYRHITAVVANIQGVHVALGFIYPQINQMSFTKTKDPNRLIERSPSDAYRTVSGDGDMDFVHPAGAYIRIGQGARPDDLEGRDFDGKWKLKHNIDKPVTVIIGRGLGRNSGQDRNPAYISMEPSGKVTVKVGAMSEDDPGWGSVILRPDGNVSISGTSITLDSVTTTVVGTLVLGSGIATSEQAIEIASNESITLRAPTITDETPTHITTGVHTDQNGVHS